MIATTSTNVKPAAMPTREQITQRAHEIWIAEGRPEGRALCHWQRAEKELCAKCTPMSNVPAANIPGNGNKMAMAGKSKLKFNVPTRSPVGGSQI